MFEHIIKRISAKSLKKKFPYLLFISIPLLLVLILNFFTFINYSKTVIGHPYYLDYAEGSMYVFAHRAYDSKPLYLDIHEKPYLSLNYPPLFIYISAFLFRLFGKSLVVGRLISLGSTLFISFFIYLIVKSYSKYIFPSLIAALLFFTSHIIYFWSNLVRVDMLAILFTVIGIFFILNYRTKNYYLYLAVLFFLLALFTKQDSITAPICAFLFLLHKEKRIISFSIINLRFRRLLKLKSAKFTFLFGTLALLSFLLLVKSSQGQAFFHCVKFILSPPFNKAQIFNLLIPFIKYNLWIFSLCLIYLLMMLTKKIKESRFIFAYFIISLLFLVRVMHDGSNTNYFIEFVVIECIIIGFLLRELISKGYNTLLLFILAMLFTHSLLYMKGVDYNIKLALIKDKQVKDHISRLIRSSKKPILTEDLTLAIINNKEPLFQPYLFYQLSELGIWDPTPLISECNKGKFELIIYTWRFDLIPDFKECIRKKYIKIYEGGDFKGRSWKVCKYKGI